MNKNIISRGIFNNKRDIKIMIVIGGIIISLLFLAMVYTKTQYYTAIGESYDNFGKHIFSISEKEKFNTIAKERFVYTSFPIYKNTIGEEDWECIIYDANHNLLEYTNIDMIYGKYPKNENEILMDSKLLHRLGYDYNYINKEITIHNGVKSKTYKLTGIVNLNFSNQSSNKIYCMITNQNKEPNELLLEIKDLKDFDNIAKLLQEKYKLKELLVNYNLVVWLGLDTNFSYIDSVSFINYIIYIILGIIISLVFYNTINYIITQSYHAIYTYKLLGISDFKLIKEINKFIIKIFLKCFILGVLLGGIIYIVLNKFDWEIINQFISNYIHFFEVSYFIKRMGIFSIIFLFSIICIDRKIYNISLQNKYINIKNNKKYKNIMSIKRRNYISKMYIRNILQKKMSSIICCTLFVSSITILILGNYFYNVMMLENETNTKMDFLFEMDEGYIFNGDAVNEFNGVASQLKKEIGEENVYIEHSFLQSASVDIKSLGDEYIETLKEDFNNYVQLINALGTINKEVLVIGYSDEKLKKLCIDNNIEWNKNCTNSIFISQKLLSPSGTEKMTSKFDVGDVITFQAFDKDYNIENKNWQIDYIVDNTLELPQVNDYYIGVIMSINKMKELWPDYKPSKIYIKTENEHLDRKIEIIEGRLNFINVFNIRSEYIENKKYNDNYNSIIFIISIICVVLAIFLIVYTNFTNISIRKKEFATYKALGISDYNIYKIILGELVTIYFISIGISFILIKIGIKYTQINNISSMNIFLVDFPYIKMLYYSIILFFILFISSFLVFRRTRKIDLIYELKAR